MKTAARVAFVLGVLAGLGWLISRFGPEMRERCHAMMGWQGVDTEKISEAADEELAEAQV